MKGYMVDVHIPNEFIAPSLHRTLESAKLRLRERLQENAYPLPLDVADIEAMRAGHWKVNSYALSEGITGTVLAGDHYFDSDGVDAYFGIHLMEVNE